MLKTAISASIALLCLLFLTGCGLNNAGKYEFRTGTTIPHEQTEVSSMLVCPEEVAVPAKGSSDKALALYISQMSRQYGVCFRSVQDVKAYELSRRKPNAVDNPP